MSQGRDGALRWGGPQPHDTVKRRALQQGALTQALLLGRPRHSRWVDVTPTTYREDRRRAAAASWGRKRGPAWWAGFATQRRTICDTPPKARSSTHSHTSSAWRVSSPGGVAQSVRQEAEPDHCAGPRDKTALVALATTRQSRNGASSPFGRSPNKGKTDGAHEREARGAPASWGRKIGRADRKDAAESGDRGVGGLVGAGECDHVCAGQPVTV